MLRQFFKIYFSSFTLLIGFNLFMSVLAVLLFLQEGFDLYGVYLISVLIKSVGYLFSVAIERMFYANRVYFFKNLGLSYRWIFTYLFLLDFGYYLLILIGCRIIGNFT
ncbi:hypothetical protein GCM10023231_02140 [Olivibacter ginsenosidimutans]|uniref:Polysaccharide biosynthesis protein n=1 Tax=Olivibacter ginsenosidimutans TaxID=1176537 RepID=A0ABP9ADC9_9SPHI